MAGAKAGKYLELSGLAVMYVEFLKGSVGDYLKKWASLQRPRCCLYLEIHFPLP